MLRDVKYAVCDRKIFLFESRPVSFLFKTSDIEITHALNSAIPLNREGLRLKNTELGKSKLTTFLPSSDK